MKTKLKKTKPMKAEAMKTIRTLFFIALFVFTSVNVWASSCQDVFSQDVFSETKTKLDLNVYVENVLNNKQDQYNKKEIETKLLEELGNMDPKTLLQNVIKLIDSPLFKIYSVLPGEGRFYEKAFDLKLKPEVTTQIRNNFFQSENLTHVLEKSFTQVESLDLYHGTTIGLDGALSYRTGMRFGGSVFNEAYRSSGDFAGGGVYTVQKEYVKVAENWGGNRAMQKTSNGKGGFKFELSEDWIVFNLETNRTSLFDMVKADQIVRENEIYNFEAHLLKKFKSWLQKNETQLKNQYPELSRWDFDLLLHYQIYQLLGVDAINRVIESRSKRENEVVIYRPTIINEKKFHRGKKEDDFKEVFNAIIDAINQKNIDLMEKTVGLNSIPSELLSVLISKTIKKDSKLYDYYKNNLTKLWPIAFEAFLYSKPFVDNLHELIWIFPESRGEFTPLHPYIGGQHTPLLSKMLMRYIDKNPEQVIKYWKNSEELFIENLKKFDNPLNSPLWKHYLKNTTIPQNLNNKLREIILPNWTQ